MLNNYTLRNGNDGDNVNCKGNDNDVNDNFRADHDHSNRRFAYNSGFISSVNCSDEDKDQWKGKRRKTKNCDLNSGKYNNDNYWRKYLPASIIAKLPAQTDAKDDEPVKKRKKNRDVKHKTAAMIFIAGQK